MAALSDFPIPSPQDAIRGLFVVAEQMRVVNYIRLAGAAFLFHDICLKFEEEVSIHRDDD
ncbi:hypothetical protein PQX77_005838 [Marasmius sp. AFHP31]|nr:hypothetical protein PQX77_005838 [Marasmius sp. AFHP31]